MNKFDVWWNYVCFNDSSVIILGERTKGRGSDVYRMFREIDNAIAGTL